MKKILIVIALFVFFNLLNAQTREKDLFDSGWLFALGHATDAKKDFSNGTGYFSYITKTGYGDGAAAANFDDRAWRKLDLPHDWCVELPFDARGGHSHGYKAIGRNFPENSVGWYRKKFTIPASDLGKKISIQFDGVFRNSIVWVNGFYLGTEISGYTSFSYDITDYLNYGGENVVAVRADATIEEGWFYEGAGIYRHVWLIKTSPLHVAENGIFITSEISGNNATVISRTSVQNETNKNTKIDIEETIIDAEGKTVSSRLLKGIPLAPGEKKECFSNHNIQNAKLWSLENPYLHKLKANIISEGNVVDSYETTFGIRTVKFDADKGFFLNGKNIKIVGGNMHQDHAGVGVAIPDGLQEYRIKQLKKMGANGIRTSHNPPTPEMLDACDRLGMLILDENRLMGCNQEHFRWLERMIKRDRNHPSVVVWSLGNEEWAIEGNVKGSRITKSMQEFAQRLDSSRAFTVAISGGWDFGSGDACQVMGYNYIAQGDIDGHHKKFPTQPAIGTEETTNHQTRGIYITDKEKALDGPYRNDKYGFEYGWKFYAERPFLSGIFFWTGFDYRGESNPYNFPAVINQSGSFDLCGFEKDYFYYLKSWWSKEPVLHIMPHWNWKGSEGKEINVRVFSNCEQVELFLNNKSLGKQENPVNGHLDWQVNYQPGTLLAKGYKNGKEILTSKVETTGDAAALGLSTENNIINANGMDVSVITVNVNDSKGLFMPTADNQVSFSVEGPGKIIGVGNGNPTSHEAERFFETNTILEILNLKQLPVENLVNRPEVSESFDDSSWKPAFSMGKNEDWQTYIDTLLVIRGVVELPEFSKEAEINLYTLSILENQSVFVNGHLISANIKRDSKDQSFKLDHSILKAGKNIIAFTGQKFRKKYVWDEPNTYPGTVQVIEPPAQWKRKVFNGLAQIILQSTGKPGEIVLKAESEGLKTAILKIQAK